VLGIKSYGRAPTFLLLTGYEQARSVTAALAGDLAAADDVHLVLPDTGICVTDFEEADCCSGTAPTSSTPVAWSTPWPRMPVKRDAGAGSQLDLGGRKNRSSRSCSRSGARDHPNSGVGFFVLSAGSAGEADRGRYRLAATLGHRRPIARTWYNQTLCQANDSVVRLGVMQGEYHWHKHDNDDEFLFVLDGEFLVDLADHTVTLNSRQGFVVPQGC
jgi:Cupin domain